MPLSRQRKRQSSELVELAPGVSIPGEFVSTFPIAGGGGSWSVHVRTDRAERVPRLVEYSVHLSDPRAVSELTDEHLRLVVENAIAQRAAHVAAERMMAGRRFAVGEEFAEHFPDVALPEGTLVLDQAELDRVAEVAAATARPKPGRRAITDEAKLAVLETYRTLGIDKAMEITGRAERTVRRYIADARRIEKGPR